MSKYDRVYQNKIIKQQEHIQVNMSEYLRSKFQRVLTVYSHQPPPSAPAPSIISNFMGFLGIKVGSNEYANTLSAT